MGYEGLSVASLPGSLDPDPDHGNVGDQFNGPIEWFGQGLLHTHAYKQNIYMHPQEFLRTKLSNSIRMLIFPSLYMVWGHAKVYMVNRRSLVAFHVIFPFGPIYLSDPLYMVYHVYSVLNLPLHCIGAVLGSFFYGPGEETDLSVNPWFKLPIWTPQQASPTRTPCHFTS